MNLPEDDKRKVAGILARLSSEHDGERAAAALLLTRILAKHKARPEELLNGGGGGGSRYGSSGFEHMAMERLLRENARLQQDKRVATAVNADLISKARRFELEARALRAELGEVKATTAKAQHQANPDAYRTPPWEEAAKEPPKPRANSAVAQEAADLLARQDVTWTSWERDFLDSMTGWRGAPTPRQESTMESLRAKIVQAQEARRKAAGIWG